MGKHRVLLAAAAAALMCLAAAGATGPATAEEEHNLREERARPGEDTSGRVQQGEASYYHPKLEGRPMANGEPFDPSSNSAASRTLPLGTTARVTNTETGRSATVEVEDRGPFARGRMLDVSPRTAEELGMKRDGTAGVEIAPIEVPQRDGSTRAGAGAAGAGGGDGRSGARGAEGGGSGPDQGRPR
jgi:rare lipoprotein A